MSAKDDAILDSLESLLAALSLQASAAHSRGDFNADVSKATENARQNVQAYRDLTPRRIFWCEIIDGEPGEFDYVSATTAQHARERWAQDRPAFQIGKVIPLEAKLQEVETLVALLANRLNKGPDDIEDAWNASFDS